jgi:glycosyltransferase involved in cell wall biosynthesis
LRLVCIPAFNEEEIINKVVQECLKYSDKVVVCDDGSSDDTSNQARAAGAVVLKHNQNKGKGAALNTLFQYARELNPDVLVTIDGDGQFLPQEMQKIVAPILNDSADVVIGYRFDDKTQMPGYRKLGNKFLDKVTKMASELPFRDTQSGFRAYSKKAINTIRFSADGFGADSEILIDAARKGLRISEEKVSVLYDTGLRTSTKDPISHSGDVIGSIIELIAIRHPLKYLGVPGVIFLALGIGYSVVVLSIFNQTRYFSIPSTFLALGSLIVGLLLLLMSVLLFSLGRANKRQ